MSETEQTENKDLAPAQAEPRVPSPEDWPAIATPLPPERVTEIARALSKKGELPGFTEHLAGSSNGLFAFDAFGKPFEHRAVARLESGELRFACEPKKLAPAVLIVTMVLTVWPGLWLTDDMLGTYSDWYAAHVETWWWYVPMLVLGLVPLPKMWRTSRAQAAEDGAKSIEKLREAVASAAQ